eukprot:EG_transcript_19880
MPGSEQKKTLVLIATGVALGTATFYLLATFNRFLRQTKERPEVKNAAPAPQPATSVPYTNAHVGLSFQYPVEWQMEESAKENVRIVTLRPPGAEGSAPDSKLSQHEVNVFVEMLEGPCTLDEYKQLSMQTLMDGLSAYSQIQVQQERRALVAGRDGWEVIHTQRFANRGAQQYELRLSTTFTVVKDKAFSVQYISSRDHGKFDPQVAALLRSLKVQEPPVPEAAGPLPSPSAKAS